MKRNEIEQKIKENLEKIETLKLNNIELTRQAILLSDELQQFSEQIESHSRVSIALDGKLIGRINWIELFKDGDIGELVEVKRSQIVRIDGQWV